MENKRMANHDKLNTNKWQILYMYTERQKKHHFFRATLNKIQSIKMNHNWAQFS